MPNAYLTRCPAQNCIAEIPVNQAFCRYHWTSLPEKAKQAIRKGFKESPRLWIEAMNEAKEVLIALEEKRNASA